MRRALRSAAFVATLSLVVAACGTAGATPSSGQSGSAGSTATVTPTSTPTATPTATLKPTPTPKPTPVPVRGQYLLYRTSIDLTDGFRPQLWVVKADGTGRHKIVDGPDEPIASPPTHDLDATWSHDGAVLHVVKYATGTSVATHCTPQISNIPIDGGPALPVGASLTNQDDNFIWSPDDTKIVFRHWVAQPDCVQDIVDNRTNLMMMNADGTGQHVIAHNVTYQVEAWTTDGTSLIGHDTDNWIQALRIDPANGHATSIGPSSADSTKVSPDGTGIAFVTSSNLHVVNSNGTGPLDLSAAPATDFGPVWSPNGTKLAFQRTIGSAIKIDVITLPAPAATVLRSTASGLNGSPCWSPTGLRVAFSLNGGAIVVVNSNGTGATSLPGISDVRLLSWQP